jgi:hypothetical protein
MIDQFVGQIVEDASGDVVVQSQPFSERMAERWRNGALRNLGARFSAVVIPYAMTAHCDSGRHGNDKDGCGGRYRNGNAPTGQCACRCHIRDRLADTPEA